MAARRSGAGTSCRCVEWPVSPGELLQAAAASVRTEQDEGFSNVLGPSLALLGWARRLMGDTTREPA